MCQTLLHCNNEIFQSITNYPRVNANSKTPLLIVGYSDGSVRIFDIDKVNIVTKMQPIGTEITSIIACKSCKN